MTKNGWGQGIDDPAAVGKAIADKALDSMRAAMTDDRHDALAAAAQQAMEAFILLQLHGVTAHRDRVDAAYESLRAVLGPLGDDAYVGFDPGRPEGDETVEVPRAALAATEEPVVALACTCGVHSDDPRYAAGHAAWCPKRATHAQPTPVLDVERLRRAVLRLQRYNRASLGTVVSLGDVLEAISEYASQPVTEEPASEPSPDPDEMDLIGVNAEAVARHRPAIEAEARASLDEHYHGFVETAENAYADGYRNGIAEARASLDVEALARAIYEDDDHSLGDLDSYRAEAIRIAAEYRAILTETDR